MHVPLLLAYPVKQLVHKPEAFTVLHFLLVRTPKQPLVVTLKNTYVASGSAHSVTPELEFVTGALMQVSTFAAHYAHFLLVVS